MVLLVLLAIIIIQDPTFLSLMNLNNILTQSSVRIIIALGVAGLIVTRDTDLSAGCRVGLNRIMIYALSGVFYAFGGLPEAGRIGSATNNPGFMYEPDAIAACVVGGVGTVPGVVTGVLIFTLINYGLTYIGINPYWQYIIKGSIIIFAVALD